MSAEAMKSLLEKLRAAAPQSRDQRDRRRRLRLKERAQINNTLELDKDLLSTKIANSSATNETTEIGGESSTLLSPTSSPSPSADVVTIRKVSNRCLYLFVGNIANSKSLHDSGTNEQTESTLQDELMRFKLWASNIGVFAEVHASLDFRLRDLPDIAELFLRQLDTIEERLKQVSQLSLSSTFGKAEASRDERIYQCPECAQVFILLSDTRKHLETVHFLPQTLYDESQLRGHDTVDSFDSWSLPELLQSIHDSINWLHRLSNMVRKASFVHQNRRANEFMLRDENGNKSAELTQSFIEGLTQLYRHYINTHVPGVGKQLGERLIQTMIIRHKRILHRRARRQVWNLEGSHYTPINIERELPSMDILSSTRKATRPKDGLTLDLPQPTMKAEKASSQAPSNVTATTVDVSAIRKAVPQSEVSRATSNSLHVSDRVLLPPRPAKAEFGKEFVCDYCGLLLQARQASNDRVWAKHIKKDLEPYVCVFDECDKPLEIYSSSKEWLAHMRSRHRMRWHCFATIHEPTFYESPDALEAHLRAAHVGQFSDEEISLLLENSDHPVEPVIEHCPFCQEMVENTEEHVAQHLIQLALRSLPWSEDSSSTLHTSQTSNSRHSQGAGSSSEARETDRSEDEMQDVRKTDWDAWKEEIQAKIAPSNYDSNPLLSIHENETFSTLGTNNLDMVGLHVFMPRGYDATEDKLLEPFRQRANLGNVRDSFSEESLSARKTTMTDFIEEETIFFRILHVLADICGRAAEAELDLNEVSLLSIVDNLTALHDDFLKELKLIFSYEQGSTASYNTALSESPEKLAVVGTSLLRNFRKIEPAHHQYCMVHDQVMSMWNRVRRNPLNYTWIKECDQLGQDEVGREFPHQQFEDLFKLLSVRYLSEYYDTWTDKILRQTPSGHPDKQPLLSAAVYHRDSVQRLKSLLHPENTASKNPILQTVLAEGRRDESLFNQVFGNFYPEELDQDDSFHSLEEFRVDHTRLEAVSKELERYCSHVKRFRGALNSYFSEIGHFMNISSSTAHQSIQSKWLRLPDALEEMEGILESHTGNMEEDLQEQIHDLISMRSKALLLMRGWNNRRGEYRRCQDLISNGYTVPEHMSKTYKEVEAIKAVLNEELPVLHSLTSRFLELFTEALASEQSRWPLAWSSTFESLTGRRDALEWDNIVECYQRDFGSMNEQIERLEIVGSSQLQGMNSPTMIEGDSITLQFESDLPPDRGRDLYPIIEGEAMRVQFGSALPPDRRGQIFMMDDDTTIESSKRSDAFQRVSQSASSDSKDDSGPSKLWSAVSLSEFSTERTKYEAGYPYLLYETGEIFDVVAEKGELWLAMKQDDPNEEVGWIWDKHFSKLQDDV